jgi:hypothetical protein
MRTWRGWRLGFEGVNLVGWGGVTEAEGLKRVRLAVAAMVIAMARAKAFVGLLDHSAIILGEEWGM